MFVNKDYNFKHNLVCIMRLTILSVQVLSPGRVSMALIILRSAFHFSLNVTASRRLHGPPPRRSSSPSYESALRERDLWPARCDDLLDLVLCEYCEEEKHQVYRHGTPEEVLCWKPCHCSWPCNRVRSIFKDETIEESILLSLIPRCVVVVVYACRPSPHPRP